MSKYEFDENELGIKYTNFDAKTWDVDETIANNVQTEQTANEDNENETDVEHKDKHNKISILSNKKFKLSLIIIAIIAISLILTYNYDYGFVYDYRVPQDSKLTTTTTIVTKTSHEMETTAATEVSTTTEDVEPDYWEGECGDNAIFTIYDDSNTSTPHYVLLIEGKGTLWKSENIDWKIENAKIKEIIVYEGITKVQEDQFSLDSIFDNVTKIDFRGSVSYIGKNACANIDSLKIVNVDNENCKIDYTDEEGYLYYTLGDTDGGVTVLCYEGSTAEEYVDTWNSNYSNSYKLKFY